MVTKRLKNEWRTRKPKPSEWAAALKLARRVDKVLAGLMEAETNS